MPTPSLPDLAAILKKLVQAMHPKVADLSDDEWHAMMASKKFWENCIADLLGIDQAALPPLPPPQGRRILLPR